MTEPDDRHGDDLVAIAQGEHNVQANDPLLVLRIFCRWASEQAHLMGHCLYRVAYPHCGQGE